MYFNYISKTQLGDFAGYFLSESTIALQVIVLILSWDTILLRDVFQLYFQDAVRGLRGVLFERINYCATGNCLNSELEYHTTAQCISIVFLGSVLIWSSLIAIIRSLKFFKIWLYQQCFTLFDSGKGSL